MIKVEESERQEFNKNKFSGEQMQVNSASHTHSTV